jgi:hypothetical protein
MKKTIFTAITLSCVFSLLVVAFSFIQSDSKVVSFTAWKKSGELVCRTAIIKEGYSTNACKMCGEADNSKIIPEFVDSFSGYCEDFKPKG